MSINNQLMHNHSSINKKYLLFFLYIIPLLIDHDLIIITKELFIVSIENKSGENLIKRKLLIFVYEGAAFKNWLSIFSPKAFEIFSFLPWRLFTQKLSVYNNLFNTRIFGKKKRRFWLLLKVKLC